MGIFIFLAILLITIFAVLFFYVRHLLGLPKGVVRFSAGFLFFYISICIIMIVMVKLPTYEDRRSNLVSVYNTLCYLKLINSSVDINSREGINKISNLLQQTTNYLVITNFSEDKNKIVNITSNIGSNIAEYRNRLPEAGSTYLLSKIHDRYSREDTGNKVGLKILLEKWNFLFSRIASSLFNFLNKGYETVFIFIVIISALFFSIASILMLIFFRLKLNNVGESLDTEHIFEVNEEIINDINKNR